MSGTEILLAIIAVEIVLHAMFVQSSLTSAVKYIEAVIKAELVPNWTELPHPVAGRPDCGHGNLITHRHVSGNTCCEECAIAGGFK